MSLVEDRNNLVPRFEARNTFANREDGPGSIGSRNDIGLLREWVLAKRNYNVAKLETIGLAGNYSNNTLSTWPYVQ